MKQAFAAILSTINAPYQEHIDEAQLAACLKDVLAAKEYAGQIWGFFGEVPVKDQLAFAEANSIPAEVLVSSAKAFSKLSGAAFPLAT